MGVTENFSLHYSIGYTIPMEVKENVSLSAAFILSVAILPVAVHDILALKNLNRCYVKISIITVRTKNDDNLCNVCMRFSKYLCLPSLKQKKIQTLQELSTR